MHPASEFAHVEHRCTPDLNLFRPRDSSSWGIFAMMVTKIIDAFGYVIYAALALLAVWGVYNGILLYRTLMKKTIQRAGAIHRPGS